MDQRKQSLHEQILKLLESKGTAREAEEFLQLPPEVLDAYLDEQEWDELSPDTVPEEWAASWLENINRSKAGRVRSLHWKYWSAAAAVLLLVMGAALYFMVPASRHSGMAENNVDKVVMAQHDTVIQNQGTAVQKYTLPDHSIVKLSPGSTLRYDNAMKANRSLWLEGEGVFDVVHDSKRPFTVYAAGLVTIDIGTVFKITTDKDKKVTNVQLISGKIAVHRLQDTAKVFYLTSGQSCRFDQTAQSLQMVPQGRGKLSADPNAQTEQTLAADEINFHNAPLPEVFQQLSKAYNIHIEYPLESLKRRKFTGSFKKSAKLEGAMETLLLLNELKSNSVGDTIYISPK
ncbi:DUF4974 domain-containing protein [Chitinophaga agrisoli]|uniref:DUF4974 domain-containing protein n=1 Tax=Chitinophaga agrisoli TaxID=2607653 RepID=A0A5B2VR82_9BACT|nr:FecR domain-containing protein [Chitinophaga agrisoli]KAA2240687.1 DUF4974 domain-containing protein [Chitinophaga agrisoli]